MFCQKGVLKNFTKFTGKDLCQSLFSDKVAEFRAQTCNFIKRLWHRCFPVNFAKFFKNFFFIKTFWWLLLKSATQNGKVSSKLKIDSNMKEQLEVINIRLLNGVFSKTSVQNDFLVCITENFDVSKHLRSLDW